MLTVTILFALFTQNKVTLEMNLRSSSLIYLVLRNVIYIFTTWLGGVIALGMRFGSPEWNQIRDSSIVSLTVFFIFVMPAALVFFAIARIWVKAKSFYVCWSWITFIGLLIWSLITGYWFISRFSSL